MRTMNKKMAEKKETAKIAKPYSQKRAAFDRFKDPLSDILAGYSQVPTER